MPIEADLIYKDQITILTELVAAWQARVPDVQITVDSVIRIILEVFSNTVEGLYLANQLLHDDIFPQTANQLALSRFGDLYGRPIKGGTVAIGSVTLTGAPGTFVPSQTDVAAPSTLDDSLHFLTDTGVTIPATGTPTAPTAADGGAGAMPVGTYEYGITFGTVLGESVIGAASNALVQAINHQVNLTAITVGGPGTTRRRIYRRINGGNWTFVHEIADNTTTTYTDNNTVVGGQPPTDSTAEQVSVTATSSAVGADYNVLTGTITTVSSSVAGLSGVTNSAPFTDGSDPEDIEEYRLKLLEFIHNPKSGSLADLEAWAEAIDGVEQATAFQNDNVGTPTNGHVTVRISGANSAVPSAAVIAAVLADLISRDLGTISVHVATFTPKVIAVSVAITEQAGYVLADVSASVIAAIQKYINSVSVGGTTYLAGIFDAVFGLPGVATLTISVPGGDTGSLATEKPTPGVITVT